MSQLVTEQRRGITVIIRRVVARPTLVELCILFIAMDSGIFLALPRSTATLVSIIGHCVLGVWFVWTRRCAAIARANERATAPAP